MQMGGGSKIKKTNALSALSILGAGIIVHLFFAVG